MTSRGETLTMRKRTRAQAAMLEGPRSQLGVRVSESRRAELTFIERACLAKLVFRSKAQAVKWLRAHPRTGNMQPQNPYKCPHCKQWHTATRRK